MGSEELMFVLYEHAMGYALFKVKEFEDVGMLLPQVEESVRDFSRFNRIVTLVSFSAFDTAVKALEAMNAISEGLLPADLKLFVDTNVPKPKPKKNRKVSIGVADAKLGAAINEELGIPCIHYGPVPEIIRGIRSHFLAFIPSISGKAASTAQLGLGHSYSRAKIKFNVHCVDNMIIQSIGLLDVLDKDINLFSMRMKEWYSNHFPELGQIVPEIPLYAKIVKAYGDRNQYNENTLPDLEDILMDSGRAQAVVKAAKSSMGMEINTMDLENIKAFAARVEGLAAYRDSLVSYLHRKMGTVAPNLSVLVGDLVGARLISQSGSLTNLAKCPASTIQILGAEKALFRALKTRTNTPKYGLLFHSTFIGKASKRNKGRISRFLANKCALATRIDCFFESKTSIFGEKMRQQVEDRLTFYENGELPPKNTDVMKEALEEFAAEQARSAVKSKKKKKKNAEEEENHNQFAEVKEEPVSEMEGVKKKKKKKVLESLDQSAGSNLDESMTVEVVKKKKKKRLYDEMPNEENAETTLNDTVEEMPKKKKKKKKHQEVDN